VENHTKNIMNKQNKNVMKKLNFEQMEQVNGGATDKQCKTMYWVGVAAAIGSALSFPFGLIIFGPTAIGMTIGSGICTYQ
jgi:hypothetical protein